MPVEMTPVCSVTMYLVDGQKFACCLQEGHGNYSNVHEDDKRDITWVDPDGH